MAEVYYRFSANLERTRLPAQVQENPDKLFMAAYWDESNQITGTSGGRNTVWFIDSGQGSWVLRHYYRGGLPGRLLHDQFLFTGIESTRAFMEFELLELLRNMQLPVPAPVAARVERKGLICRSDILIEKIPDSEDLYHRLLKTTLSTECWQEIGQTIRKFHQQGVWHADLNCHNILLTDAKVWLIDFDRCAIKSGTTWQARNLLRLKRSLVKESERAPNFHFSDQDWITLMHGYSLAN